MNERDCSVNKHSSRALKLIGEAWTEVIYRMSQMNQASLIKPKTHSEIFTLDEGAPDDEVKLNFGPIVFNVPERPNKDTPNLFVVVKGWLIIEPPEVGQKNLRTKNFGTEVAYFRKKEKNLAHIYGAHFDMDEHSPGHPIFHAQFGPKQDFIGAIHDLFKRDEEILNQVGEMLRTVRTPTAQMDIFSVITQICADHLMNKDSGHDVKNAFAQLRESSNILIGAAHRLPFLSDASAARCYRASHWYDAPGANA